MNGEVVLTHGNGIWKSIIVGGVLLFCGGLSASVMNLYKTKAETTEMKTGFAVAAEEREDLREGVSGLLEAVKAMAYKDCIKSHPKDEDVCMAFYPIEARRRK